MLRPAVLTAIVAAVLLFPLPARADWPTLHKDYQRSGYSEETVKGPYQRKWFVSLVEEMVGPRCEAIVAERLCFVDTYAGNVYALDIDSGKTAWKRHVGGAVGHSPCYDAGNLYACSDDGYASGSLVCLQARDGTQRWRYRAAAGIWNSPACDGRQVYVGDRAGTFHAVDVKTGKAAWTFQTGAMILKPASFSPDGQQVVFGSEDMHVYCLSPAGKLLWKSPKLAGLSLRDGAPTVWDGRVIVRTNPSRPFHESLHEGGRLVCDIQRQIPLDEREDKVYPNTTKNQYFLRRTDRREKAENAGVVQYLKEHPHSRTWFTLSLADGREPWIAPLMYTGGLHNPPTPPTFNPKTRELYTTIVTALGVYCDGVSQVGIGIGRVDPQTGYVTNVDHAMGDRVPGYFAGMTMIADETSALGLMGDFLVCSHQGAIGGVDLKTRKTRTLHGARDSYGGLFGPGVHGSWDGSAKLAKQGFVENTINEWHGPDRSIAAISDNRFFWVVGGCVVCFAGPDVKAAESGGDKPPAPWKWQKMPRLDGANLTSSLGGADSQVEKKVLTPAEIEKYVAVSDEKYRQDAGATSRLDAAVSELIDGHPWALWIVQLGISHEEQHFWRTAETMQVVAMALPHLSPFVRERAVAYLDKLFDDGVPLGRPTWGADGRRREHYDLAPEVLAGNAAKPPQYAAQLADLYALWAYVHYADRWDKVLAKAGDLRRFGEMLKKLPRFDPAAENGNAVATLNGQIAGAMAYVRIMRRAGQTDEARAAAEVLARLMSDRVYFELSEKRLQSRREHHAAIPRYLNLTPEIGRLLADHAGEALKTNFDDLNRQLPVWYQAWGERLIGGENYISPPGLARGLFLAAAYGGWTAPEKLTRYLDQPWCKGDLYYIGKLTAALTVP